ncbi:hypothetical protein AAHC03_013772 [Spirometra sp. Aus1]
MGEPKVISLKEVQKHNKKDDCWLVIHDKVYDVTNFIDEHPGGDEVILEQVGGYATEPFEDVGHSDAAHEQLEKYCIGVIAPEDKESKYKFTTSFSRTRETSLAGWPTIAAVAASLLTVGTLFAKYFRR